MSDRWLSLLLTQAWQLTLVIVVVALLSRRFANKRPHLAVTLWLVVLAKAITPPVWSSPLGVFSWSIPKSAPAQGEVAPARSTPLPVTVSTPLPSPEPWPAPSTELISLPDEPAEAPPIPSAAPPAEIRWPEADRGPTEPRRWSWAGVALSLWLAGAGLTLLVLCSRLAILWRRLSRAGAAADDALAAQIDALRKRLKLRRRVRVWVTPTDHGPAVLGLFRPWLLLPRTLVDQVAPADLEPLLAHELLHIRRGDLWIGWWQAVVQAAWWLHPLVWWSNRVLTRQLERCCDEEVLAELGCEPARYARGLLKALELKHRLQPVPAAPGVRPVDLTAERMERIMRTGQGSRRRTPWWCWGVMGIGLLVTLPGAGLQLGAEEPGKVLSGVGVESEAGVTGTVVLGEAGSTPTDAHEPAVVISGKDFEVRADAIRVRVDSELPVEEPPTLRSTNDPPNEPWGRILVEADGMPEIQSLRHVVSDSNFQLRDFAQRVRQRCQYLGYPFAKIELLPGGSGRPQNTTLKLHRGLHATLTGVAPDPSDLTRPLKFATALPAAAPPYQTIASIESLFRDSGFFEVKVTAEAVSNDRRDYIVDRGRRALVRSVRFDDAMLAPHRELRDLLGIAIGKVFDGPMIRERSETLRLILKMPHPVFSTWLAIPRMAGEQPVVDLMFVSDPDLPKADWSRITTHPQRPTYADTRNPLHAWPYEAPVEYAVGDKAYAYVGTDPSPQLHVMKAADDEASDKSQQPAAEAAHVAAPVPQRTAPLDQRVTMTIKDRPLDELLAELARQHEFSFVIDQVGLEEEGVRKSVPVSGEFRDVALRNMLKLLVEQTQNLVLLDRDGVLLITSRGRAEPLEVRTYAVADFLVPPPGTELSSNESSEPRKDLTTPAQRARTLVGMIHSTVQPDSWVEAGGKGQIQFYEATLSLVIRQTPSIHEQIAELFAQLRRRHDAQVSLQLVERSLTAEEWKALSPDGHRQRILGDGADRLPGPSAPKVTFFNGQRASLPGELAKQRKDRALLLSFDVIPVIAEDQKSVTLTLLPASHLSRFVPRSINVPDGRTALVDISDTLPAGDPALQNGGHVVLQITPRVIQPEQSEPEQK